MAKVRPKPHAEPPKGVGREMQTALEHMCDYCAWPQICEQAEELEIQSICENCPLQDDLFALAAVALSEGKAQKAREIREALGPV